MSTVIVKADLATAKQYTGKSLSVKIGKKKFSAVLRVNVDDFNIAEAIELAKRDANILMLNYVGSHEGIKGVNTCGVYVAWGIDVGSDVTEDDIQRLYDDVPDGVTLIVKLPEGYKNIRFLYDMSHKFDRVRFCGGSLFCLRIASLVAVVEMYATKGVSLTMTQNTSRKAVVVLFLHSRWMRLSS